MLKSHTTFVLFLALLALSGCVAPIQPDLWKSTKGEVPAEIVLARAILVGDGNVGKRVYFELPPGRYTLWYENKVGYYYRQEGTKIKKMPPRGVVTEFDGGFQLSKRIYFISIYELVSLKDDYKKHGELSVLSAWEQGDKDGMTRNHAANIPFELFPEFGFPSEHLKTKRP